MSAQLENQANLSFTEMQANVNESTSKYIIPHFSLKSNLFNFDINTFINHVSLTSYLDEFYVLLIEEFMSGASRDFIKEAVFFNSRADFENHMRQLENQYYQTVNLPKTPYCEVQSQTSANNYPQNNQRGAGEQAPHASSKGFFLPEWPPKPSVDFQ